MWNMWEISALQDNGLPVTCLGKIIYSCKNEYIVESKSLKLYFNSFNMTKMGETREDVITRLKYFVEKDLTTLLNTEVTLSLFDSEKSWLESPIDWSALRIEDKYNPECIEYKANPSLLKVDTSYREKNQIQRLYTTLLKSNCKITSQKDEGTLFVHYKGKHAIDCSSLLQYIVSFRDINEFHESTLETIYTTLNNYFKPEELMVAALYTRRGGISISPVRASSSNLLKELPLIDPKKWTQTIRQ